MSYDIKFPPNTPIPQMTWYSGKTMRIWPLICYGSTGRSVRFHERTYLNSCLIPECNVGWSSWPGTPVFYLFQKMVCCFSLPLILLDECVHRTNIRCNGRLLLILTDGFLGCSSSNRHAGFVTGMTRSLDPSEFDQKAMELIRWVCSMEVRSVFLLSAVESSLCTLYRLVQALHVPRWNQ